MMRFAWLLIAVLLSPAAWATAAGQEREILKVVQGFYGWVLRHGQAVQSLQPAIEQGPGKHRLRIDVSSLPQFKAAYMGSGYFTTDFGQTLERFYKREQNKLNAIPEDELKRMTHDGPGPMLPTENMDIFFCAQEYEYTREFVSSMALSSTKITGPRAHVLVESPLGWKTPFQLVKHNSQWQITGYCVFQ